MTTLAASMLLPSKLKPCFPEDKSSLFSSRCSKSSSKRNQSQSPSPVSNSLLFHILFPVSGINCHVNSISNIWTSNVTTRSGYWMFEIRWWDYLGQQYLKHQNWKYCSWELIKRKRNTHQSCPELILLLIVILPPRSLWLSLKLLTIPR